MPSDLPWDIQCEVIAQVSNIPNTLSSARTLSTLRLVNHEFNCLSTSLLYAHPPPFSCSCPTSLYDIQSSGMIAWKIALIHALIGYPHLAFYNLTSTTLVDALKLMPNLHAFSLRSHSPWNSPSMNAFFEDVAYAISDSGAELRSLTWSSTRSIVEFKHVLPLLSLHSHSLTSLSLNFTNRPFNPEGGMSRIDEYNRDRSFIRNYDPDLFMGLSSAPIFPLPVLRKLVVSSYDTLDLFIPFIVSPGQLNHLFVTLPNNPPCMDFPVDGEDIVLQDIGTTTLANRSPNTEDDRRELAQFYALKLDNLMKWLSGQPMRTATLSFGLDGEEFQGYSERFRRIMASVSHVEALTLVLPSVALPEIESIVQTIGHELVNLRTLGLYIIQNDSSALPIEYEDLKVAMIALFGTCSGLRNVFLPILGFILLLGASTAQSSAYLGLRQPHT
ncbi:hypothetical protein CVT24_006358 [Panaeolus cyanescens]|uniref:Uncharacterized protein n=1 Tax=Panaeolus cyanescens TaxID=181874 RepID=A0A409YE97_9AGAR|nr:hypothetical protein CVT24_006358 [Panaeolus cyanescens]